ncbi:MAG: PHB depolymerase family esterase [Anaerolineae bacterium]
MPAAAQEPAPTPLTLPAGRYSVKDTVDGVERTYLLDIPESYVADPTQPAPLVIVLHGTGGTGATIADYAGFDAIGERERLIVVYPDGLNANWADGRPGGDGTEDIAFIGRMIDALSVALNIDPAHVYALGHSTGGTMAERLACTLPDRIAAVGSVAGPMPEYLKPECDGSAPVPILLIQGTDDSNFPWTGVPNTFLGALKTRDYWARHNQCGISSAQTPLPDTSPTDGTLTILEQFTLCTDNAGVDFYGVYGGGHTYPGHTFPGSEFLGGTSMDFDAAEVLWSFFEAHSG